RRGEYVPEVPIHRNLASVGIANAGDDFAELFWLHAHDRTSIRASAGKAWMVRAKLGCARHVERLVKGIAKELQQRSPGSFGVVNEQHLRIEEDHDSTPCRSASPHRRNCSRVR